MAEQTEKQRLIIKCIDYYIFGLTDGGKKCPTIEEMKEIVKLDEIRTSLTAPKAAS